LYHRRLDASRQKPSIKPSVDGYRRVSRNTTYVSFAPIPAQAPGARSWRHFTEEELSTCARG
jgi:hypothetical protein